MAQTAPRQLITIAAAAEYAAVSQSTIRRHVASGLLPAYRIGCRVRIDFDELNSALTPLTRPGGHDAAA